MEVMFTNLANDLGHHFVEMLSWLKMMPQGMSICCNPVIGFSSHRVKNMGGESAEVHQEPEATFNFKVRSIIY